MEVYSVPDLFGGLVHKDAATGETIGESRPAVLGGFSHFDNIGNMVGYTPLGVTATNYDADGSYVGYSSPTACGGWSHYDSNGDLFAESRPSCFGYETEF